MKSLHYIQHVRFEDPAHILAWADINDFTVSSTKLYNGEKLPDYLETDLLVVMGGSMGIYDYDEFHWLKQEKKFLEKEIDQGTNILGICLGAQLIADVLGAPVTKGKYKEIGWHSIEKSDEAKSSPLFQGVPNELFAFHWHGDTFETPSSATHLFSSEACKNQGFLYNNNVMGFQFHWESTLASIETLIANCGDELIDSPYIQQEKHIIHEAPAHITTNQRALDSVLDQWINTKQ